MGNTVTNLLRTWLAGGMVSNAVLRNTSNLLRNVSRDFSDQPAQKGSKVVIPLPATKTASAVTAAMTPPTPSDTSNDKVEIALDQHYYPSFALTDLEVTQIMAGEFFSPSNVSACIAALVENVGTYLHTKTHGANGFFGYVGTAGTTPFTTNSDILADAQEVLTNNKSPLGPRYAIINPAAQKAAMKLAEFRDVSQMGTPQARMTGVLPMVNGFEPYVDQQVPPHTTGAAGTPLLDDSAARAVGTLTLHMDGFTTKPSPGDIFTIAGDTQTYRVVSSTTLVGTDSDVTFYPGLKVAIPAVDGNEAVTFKASYKVNTAFHPAAIQLVTRPLITAVTQIVPGLAGGNLIGQADMSDPDGTGINVRCSIYQGWGMAAAYFDCLYGGEVVRPEMGVILAG